ncbi:MAG: pyridoxamine 5'-phosphate oxidase family protein [Deltaproteobacteria bacterium]|nr:pyridoxamine 5'-phosphate oxidase family protein [Deltaproteobacteria bacterium]
MQGLDTEAKVLLGAARFAVLSTWSVQEPGYPFGSVVPFLALPDGRVLLLISGLAMHTKNLAADGRCSLMVLAGGAGLDLQEQGRLTLVCDAVKLPDADVQVHKGAWMARHAGQERVVALGDFRFWALTARQSRMVAGFGKMGWLPGTDWLKAPVVTEPDRG